MLYTYPRKILAFIIVVSHFFIMSDGQILLAETADLAKDTNVQNKLAPNIIMLNRSFRECFSEEFAPLLGVIPSNPGLLSNELKVGDVIISRSGTRREILSIKSNRVTVKRIGKNGQSTTQIMDSKDIFTGVKQGIARIERSPLNVGDVIISQNGTYRKVLSIEGDLVIVESITEQGQSMIQTIKLADILKSLEKGIIQIQPVVQQKKDIGFQEDQHANLFREKLLGLKSSDFTSYHRLLKILGAVIGLKSTTGAEFLDVRNALNAEDEQRILRSIDFKLDQTNINDEVLERFIVTHGLNPYAYVPIKNLLIDLWNEFYKQATIIIRTDANEIIPISPEGSMKIQMNDHSMVFQIVNGQLRFQREGGSERRVSEREKVRYRIVATNTDFTVSLRNGGVIITNNSSRLLEMIYNRQIAKKPTQADKFGADITEEARLAVNAREQKVMLSLANQEAFPKLQDIHFDPITTLKERGLILALFSKIIGNNESVRASALKEILIFESGINADRASEILNIVLDGRLDEANNGLTGSERKQIYEAIFLKAKIWKTISGEHDTLINFLLLSRGIKEKYFGVSGETGVEIYFGASNLDFAQEVVKQREKIYGRKLDDAAKAKIIKEYSSGRIGGVNLPYRMSNGAMASIIIMNLGVDGFGKVLSSIFHEMAHNILNDLARASSGSKDAAFIHEGVAEDFAVFALDELCKLYEDDDNFRSLANRRRARVLKEKIGLPQYRNGFLLMETIRLKLGREMFCDKGISTLIQIVKGNNSVKNLSALIGKNLNADQVGDVRFNNLHMPSVSQIEGGKYLGVIDTLNQAI